MIRWKEIIDEDGNKKRVSNTRIVKWSDGSMHLMIGNKTAYKIKLQNNRSFHYIYSDINNIPNLQAQAKVDQKMEMVPDTPYAKFQQQYVVRQNGMEVTKKQGTGYIARPVAPEKVFF